MKKKKYLIYSIAAMLSAFSAIIQLLPFWPTTWGMRIDLVTLPWFLALFLFGWEASLLTSILSFLLIGLIAASSWLGAGMKLIATLSVLIPLYFSYNIKKKAFNMFWAALLLGIVLRSGLMIVVNYYIALPIWMHLTPAEVIAKFPWYMIAIPNTVQTIIEVLVAYVLVFKTKLKTYITA